MNLTCNSTLEDLRIGSEEKLVGSLTFHQLALIIAGASALIAILTSFYLIWRHATNYTKPREQKHIIRILLMVPIYATSSFLCIWYYWHAVYFQVISDCYEAFAISSFFALMCHYMAPDLHEQKQYFRYMQPVKPWVMPINWFAKCCGGQKGIWRTPKSGLTWFNIIWIGIYHYCFIRVAMTITAVVTQYFERYCESSDSPIFAHIWVIVLESVAVTIAMYCVIQFYIQLREPLAEHKPFLKVLAIKLVIFLSFWQSAAISVGTSTLHLVEANNTLAYPDIKIGIPSLLLCFEMSLFAILHLWAFPYAPYKPDAKTTFYPVADPSSGMSPRENEHSAPQGGKFGVKAYVDALNIWDVVKAFGRGMRWLFVGVKHRHNDSSYQINGNKLRHDSVDTAFPMSPYGTQFKEGQKSTEHLPIAQQFRRSTFGIPTDQRQQQEPYQSKLNTYHEENDGLIEHAQDFSTTPPRTGSNSSPYHDPHRADYESSGRMPTSPAFRPPYQPYMEDEPADIKHQTLPHPPPHQSGWMEAQAQSSSSRGRPNPRTSTQIKFGNALWGDRGPQGPR